MEQLSRERLTIRADEVDSTNLYMKRLAREVHPEEGSLVIADHQTAGRGQMGSSWFSTKGSNLTFSLLIYPGEVEVAKQFIISRIASLAVKNTLDQFTDDIRIKWPNDIYWKDKKIAGILIENDIQGKHIENSVIGIGININQQDFPPELPNPVSLRQITGTLQNRDYILETFMREFFLLYRDLQQGETETIEDEYMLDLYRINDFYWFEDGGGKFQARIENVMPSGHLLLRTLDGDEVRKYAFKEISFID
ncbi:MAG: biotin--[acetyl-CoA-carboxylase] ligase [Proteiniphilum sp.]